MIPLFFRAYFPTLVPVPSCVVCVLLLSGLVTSSPDTGLGFCCHAEKDEETTGSVERDLEIKCKQTSNLRYENKFQRKMKSHVKTAELTTSPTSSFFLTFPNIIHSKCIGKNKDFNCFCYVLLTKCNVKCVNGQAGFASASSSSISLRFKKSYSVAIVIFIVIDLTAIYRVAHFFPN